MQIVRLAAYGAFGFSVLGMLLFIQDMFVPFLGAAISLAVAGILLLALDRILNLLTDIRDALRGKAAGVPDQPAPAPDAAAATAPRSADEIAADIRRMSDGRT